MNENLITIPQLCKELGIGRTTAYKMIKSDQLAHGYLGRKIVIHRSEVERYIASITNQAEKNNPI